MKTPKKDKIQCPECKRWLNKKGIAIVKHALNGRKTCKIKGGKGSKSKLDEGVVKIFVKAVELGLTIGSSCIKAGITRETYGKWKRDYSDFSDKIKEAKISRQEFALKSVRIGMITDWRAGAWELERRDKRYKERKEIKLDDDRPILIQDVIVLDEYKKKKPKNK